MESSCDGANPLNHFNRFIQRFSERFSVVSGVSVTLREAFQIGRETHLELRLRH